MNSLYKRDDVVFRHGCSSSPGTLPVGLEIVDWKLRQAQLRIGVHHSHFPNERSDLCTIFGSQALCIGQTILQAPRISGESWDGKQVSAPARNLVCAYSSL
jgi:hypothetical protein